MLMLTHDYPYCSPVLFMAEAFDAVCQESVKRGKVPVELVEKAAELPVLPSTMLNWPSTEIRRYV